ncbi:hypothetical protein BDW22DRAFT_1341651 [Trametopsis cervina]|nr:hypothetical protein BDW22DRAFT_1341651 [Trametopsis cervina]
MLAQLPTLSRQAINCQALLRSENKAALVSRHLLFLFRIGQSLPAQFHHVLMPRTRTSSKAYSVEMDCLSVTETIASLETSSTLTICDVDGEDWSGGETLLAADEKTLSQRSSFFDKAQKDTSEIETSLYAAYRTMPGLNNIPDDKDDSLELVGLECILGELLRTCSDSTADCVSTIVLACVYDGHGKSVARALSNMSWLKARSLLWNFSQPNQRRETFRRHVAHPAFKPCEDKTTCTDRSLHDMRHWALGFLCPILHACWDGLDFDTVKYICGILDAECVVVAPLFRHSSQDFNSPPKYMQLFFTYLSTSTGLWPFLGYLDDNHFYHLPDLWPITEITSIIPETSSPAMTDIVNRILRAIDPHVEFDPTHEEFDEYERVMGRRLLPPSQSWSKTHYFHHHPATPFLWFGLYLANNNRFAARMFIEGGIVQRIFDFYDCDFADCRLSAEEPEGTMRQGSYNLSRLCYMVMRAVDKHDKKEMIWDAREREKADELKHLLREEVREHARLLSARYHDADTVNRDEMLAELQERRYRDA